ncbi:MAG TPA: serine hydrolase domain-containing protein, partial [Vicinamibacterales bacterium]
MAKSWNRIETWLTVGIGGVGLVILAIAGLWVYVSATATPLHPDAKAVESVSGGAPAQQWTSAVEQGRQIARAAVAEHNLPGLSVAVGTGSDIVWAEGFGWADIEKKVPVDPNLRFRIGTASTALTSAAVGLLLERSKLNLDAEVQAYVPEFPKKQWPVTVRQVMGHVAGLRNDGGDEGELLGDSCGRPVEGLKAFANSELLFEPGTRFRYSSYGWILMSAAVEAVSGEPFLRFMKAQVFEPLGMNDTVPDSGSEPKATPYFPRFAADPRYGPDVMRDVDLS